MTVKLLHNSPLWLASHAIRMSHDNHDKSDTHPHEVDFALDDISDFHLNGRILKTGDKDRELIARVGNKLKHKSVLEHLHYQFDVSGISRALLQEFSRHRMMSQTVKSTRYTLKELKDEKPFVSNT